MALTVRDIMDADPVSVTVVDSVELVLGVMREHDLRGVPVVNEGGRCVGIITEADLVLSDEGEDFHLPHTSSCSGASSFLEPMSKFEERARKAFAATAEDMMTPEPITIEPDAHGPRGCPCDRGEEAQPPPGDRARPPRRRRDPRRRARGAGRRPEE